MALTEIVIAEIALPHVLAFFSWLVTFHVLWTFYKVYNENKIGNNLSFKDKRRKGSGNNRVVPVKILVLSTITQLCFSVCMTFCVSHAWWYYVGDDHRATQYYIAKLVFTVGDWLLYMLMLQWLNDAFANTMYDYPKWIKIIYVAFSTFYILWLLAVTNLEYWETSGFAIQYDLNRIAETIFDPILTIMILYLFNKNIFELAKTQIHNTRSPATSSVSSPKSLEDSSGLPVLKSPRSKSPSSRSSKISFSSDSGINPDSSEVKAHMKLLNVAIRNTVAVTFILIYQWFTMGVGLYFTYEIVPNYISGDIDASTFQHWLSSLWIITYFSCFIHIFVIYLKLTYFDRVYWKCCAKCHYCCLKCHDPVGIQSYIKDMSELAINIHLSDNSNKNKNKKQKNKNSSDSNNNDNKSPNASVDVRDTAGPVTPDESSARIRYEE